MPQNVFDAQAPNSGADTEQNLGVAKVREGEFRSHQFVKAYSVSVCVRADGISRRAVKDAVVEYFRRLNNSTSCSFCLTIGCE